MKKFLVLSLIADAGLLVSCPGNGQLGSRGSGGWMPMMHYGSGYGGTYMWIILLIVVGVGVYYFIQNQKTKGRTPIQQAPTQNESHLDILKKRYAKGEIAKEEYEKTKKDLEG
jgi:putative membrane protein